MSFSLGSSKKTTNQSTTSQADPWDVTIPSLTTLISDLNASKSFGATPGQSAAYASLLNKAQAGSPYYNQIDNLTNDLFGATSRAPQVDAAYGTLQNQIGDIAAGKNLDPNTNPYIAQMLSTVGNDISNRVKQTFAGAGRDITGNAAGLQALGRGVAAGQTPILADFFNQEQQRQLDAAKTLYGAGTESATTAQGLDKDALSTRTSGISAADSAVAARDLPENTILQLEQQLKSLPLSDLSQYASLLLPIAQLGGQRQGTGTATTTGSQSGFTVGLGDIGKTIAALGTLSDERAKDDIEEVGETHDGQKLYRYRYKGDPAWHIGLIAQEVEQTHPEAVRTGPDGLKRVDYKLATDEAVGA